MIKFVFGGDHMKLGTMSVSRVLYNLMMIRGGFSWSSRISNATLVGE